MKEGILKIQTMLDGITHDFLDGNMAGCIIKQLELAKITSLLRCRPQSLWEPAKRQAVVRGLLATEHLSGPVVEMGVYTGGGTFLLATILEYIGSKRSILAVDSFEGLPAPTEHDRVPSMSNAVHYVQGMFSEASHEMLTYLLDAWGHGQRVRVFKGYFDQVLASRVFPKASFSMVIIDPDQYAGTKLCLEFFYSRMESGGLIFVDDYRGTLAEGVNRAVDEFLDDKPEIMEQGGLTMWFMRKL